MEKFNEKFNELRKRWIGAIKTIKSLSTQTLYFLLEPDDDNKFFENVDSFKECIEETLFIEFQILAIEYLLEYKKQNGPKIEKHTSNTGSWPFTHSDNDQIKKCTKQNAIPGKPFVPVITTNYSTPPNITYTQDNITSTSNSPDRSAFRCIDCEFFDGDDLCGHLDNFGTIIRKSLDNCVKNNLRREKLEQ